MTLWNGLTDVTVDSSGNAYLADLDNHRVQVCTRSGSCSTSAGVTGELGSGDDRFDNPFGVAVDGEDHV